MHPEGRGHGGEEHSQTHTNVAHCTREVLHSHLAVYIHVGGYTKALYNGQKDTLTSKGYLLVKDGKLYQGAVTEAA